MVRAVVGQLGMHVAGQRTCGSVGGAGEGCSGL